MNPYPAVRPVIGVAFAMVSALGAGSVQANQVYRCPGPVPAYTDQLTAQQAKERGCSAIEGAPVTVVNNAKPRPVASSRAPVAAAATASAGAPAASRPGDSRVSEREQRERDRDARRILEGELRQEEEKLAAMKKDFNHGEPERQGNERNYQRYLDRVEEMRTAIARKEKDIEAIQRELAKLGSDASPNERRAERPR